jgi:hypothetical protein
MTTPIARAFAGRRRRRSARSWLLRHPEHAAAGIVARWTADPADAPTGRVLRYLDTQVTVRCCSCRPATAPPR